MLTGLSYSAILTAAIASFVIGGLWYSPMLFGPAWMKELNIKADSSQTRNMGKILGLAFVATLIIAINLSAFLGPNATVVDGAFYGFLTG